jgi:hypothetical protein
MTIAFRLAICATVFGLGLGNPGSARADGLFDRILRVMGISATPSQMKGDGDVIAGEIWIAELKPGRRRALTTDSGYRWPVFEPGGESVVSLKGESVVRISVKAGELRVLETIPGVEKLVGFDADQRDNLLIVLSDDTAPLAMVSLKTGQLTPLPYDPKLKDHRRMLSHVKGQERLYAASRVYVKTESKQSLEGTLEWDDVYVQQGDAAPRNVSDCDGVTCSQPSLSPNGMAVVYIRASSAH